MQLASPTFGQTMTDSHSLFTPVCGSKFVANVLGVALWIALGSTAYYLLAEIFVRLFTGCQVMPPMFYLSHTHLRTTRCGRPLSAWPFIGSFWSKKTAGSCNKTRQLAIQRSPQCDSWRKMRLAWWKGG